LHKLRESPSVVLLNKRKEIMTIAVAVFRALQQTNGRADGTLGNAP